MSFFFSKLPEVSFEHFSKHYGHIHSDLTVAAQGFGAFDVQRYTQVRASPSHFSEALAGEKISSF